jgi:hypothetical protein
LLWLRADAAEKWVFASRPEQIAKLVERLRQAGRALSVCYEAGPAVMGYIGS